MKIVRFCCACMVSVVFCAAQSTSIDDAWRAYRTAVVQVNAFGRAADGTTKDISAGVGVILSTDGYILTAQHVVGRDDEWFRKPSGELDRKVEISRLDSTGTTQRIVTVSVRPIVGQDLVLIRITGSSLPTVRLAVAAPSKVGPVSAIVWDAGDGSPHPVSGTFINTDVNTKGDVLSVQLPQVLDGYSGSPVFDATGRVFGIITNRQGGGRAAVAAVAANAPWLPRIDITDPIEREHLQRFLNELCDRGVLQNPGQWEVIGAVFASITEIRDQIAQLLRELPADSKAVSSLLVMQKAAREMLQNPTVFPNGATGLPRPITPAIWDATESFRRVFEQQSAALAKAYVLIRHCSFSARLKPLDAGEQRQPVSKKVNFALTAGGFTNKCSGRPQVPGTACGWEGIAFYEGANGPLVNTTIIKGRAGVPMSFRWDHCWVCQGQGFKNYPQNLGTITFGEGTMSALPEIAGIATVTYPVPGTYGVTVKINATCIDRNHPDNACGGRANLQVVITR